MPIMTQGMFYVPNKPEYQQAGLFGPFLDWIGPYSTAELAQCEESMLDAQAAQRLAEVQHE